MRRHAVVALMGAALLAGALAGTASAAPRPGTFAGTLGVPVPKGGVAEVRAVNRASGVVSRSRTVGRSGAFTLTLPPGRYFVAGAVIPPRGRARPTTIGVAVSLKAGQRRRGSKLTARKTLRRAARSAARELYVQERGQVTPGSVAVQIPYFTGATGELSVFNRGLADMLTTDVVNNDCDVAVREVNRIGDVLKELELQQSPYFDPAGRVQRNFITSDVEVRGSLRTERAPLPAGSRLAYELNVVDLATGETLSTLAGKIDADRIFEGEQDLAKQLNEELCKLSDVYEVKIDVAGILRAATHDGSGTLRSTVRATRGTEGGGRVWRGSGALVWGDLAFSSKVGCAMTSFVAGAAPWSVTILDAGGGQLAVTWAVEDVGAAANSSASIDCPPQGSATDPPPIPGLAGPSLLNTGPQAFRVPYAGGKQSLSGEISLGADGFFNSGTITVTPKGVAKKRK